MTTTPETPQRVRQALSACLDALAPLSDEELPATLASLALAHLFDYDAKDPVENVRTWCRGVLCAALAERSARAN